MADSRKVFSDLKKHPERYYLIHYSCQSLYDDNEGLSPRITSIAITHYSSEQCVSFSTHAIAEELGVAREDVQKRFDDIERRLLEDFYAFVRDRRDKFWLHWNMQNITYGFEHLEHRFRTLTKQQPAIVPVERRINIDSLIKDRYGDDFATKPRMAGLMDLNGGRHRNFLTGPEEVEAFENGEFIRMHNSTQSKVWFFKHALNAAMSGTLITNSSSFWYKLDRVFENRWIKLLGVVGWLVSFLAGSIGIWQFVS